MGGFSETVSDPKNEVKKLMRYHFDFALIHLNSKFERGELDRGSKLSVTV